MARSLFDEGSNQALQVFTQSAVVTTDSEKGKLMAKLAELNPSDRNQIEVIKQSLVPGDFKSIEGFAGQVTNVTNAVVEGVLKTANSTSMDQVGGGINNILLTAKKIDASSLVGASDKSSFLGKIVPWFNNSKEKIMAQFSSLGTQIDKYTEEIKKSMATTHQSISVMEDMGKQCVSQYNLLEGIILAGKVRLIEIREDLALEKQRFSSMNPADVDPLEVQNLQKKESFVDTLEKKVSNLEQMQQVIYLQIPQLTIMVKNAVDAKNEFQAIIDTTIPLWKSQFTQALILDQQKRAGEVIKATKDFTNQLLRDNAENLKVSTLQLAEQGSRGLVDQATLEHVQNNLISTIEGTLQIYAKASDSRKKMTESIEKMRLDFKDRLQNTKQIGYK